MDDIKQDLFAYTCESVYSFDNMLLLNDYPKRIIKRLKKQTAVSLLELGLGHGITTVCFNEFFKRHVVIDGDLEVISQFHKKAPSCNAEIIHSFFEDFDTNEKFDVIVLGFILEHVDDPVLILKRFQNFLSENGRIFITVPNAQALNRRIGHLAGILSDLYELSSNDVSLGHKRYYDVESIQKDCQAAGLQIKSMEGLFLKPLTTEQMLHLNLKEEILDAFCTIGMDYPELSLGILAEAEIQSENAFK